MSEFSQPPPEYVVKKTQHQIRKEYVVEREQSLSLLPSLLVDKNGKQLKGAALESKKASLLREMEYGKDAPTFAKILEQKKAKCEEAIRQELEHKQITEAVDAEAVMLAYTRSTKNSSPRLRGIKNRVVSVAIFLTVAFGFKGSMNVNSVEVNNTQVQQPTTAIEPAPISRQTEMSLAGYATPLPSDVAVAQHNMGQKPKGEATVSESDLTETALESENKRSQSQESIPTEEGVQQEDIPERFGGDSSIDDIGQVAVNTNNLVTNELSPDAMMFDKYKAPTEEKAIEVAQNIDFIGPDSPYEHPSNMCGPLAASILKDMNILPEGFVINPSQFWLANPDVVNRLLPSNLFERYNFDQSIDSIDFAWKPGDFAYLYGGSFDHMITISRVDSGGRVYALSNYKNAEGKFIVDEFLLHDPKNPENGLFHEWTHGGHAGTTGLNGAYVWRHNGTSPNSAGIAMKTNPQG